MSTEREHAHDRKHDDDHRDHDDRSVGRVNRSALLTAPTNPVTSGLIARKAARDDNGVEAGADQAIATATSSSGMALPSPIMRKFEASLGADLSGVRVHTGAESQSAASAVGAKAYTMGQDIHFGAGHYDPSSGAGEHLLAHEVAHTVQQGGGTPTRQNKLEVSTPFDPAEHEADAAADAIVAGRSASVSFGSGVARKVMREEAEGEAGGDGKPPGTPAVAGAGQSGTWHVAEVKLPEGKAGIFELESVYSVDIGYEVGVESATATPVDTSVAPTEPSDSYDQKRGAKPTPPPAVNVGASAGKDGEVSIQGEIEKEIEGGFTNFKPSLKGGYELSGRNIKVEMGLEYETKWGPVTFGTAPFTFSIVKWEAGKTPEFAVASASLAAKIPLTEWESHGTKYSLDCEGKFEIEAKPDPVELGKWISEHFGEVLTAEALVPAGLVIGGVLAVGEALMQIAKSDEITERTDPEIKKCVAYCRGYEQAMRGEAMAGGEGTPEGYAAGEAHRQQLEASTACPQGSVVLAAQKQNIFADAWHKAWPQVRERIIASYWDEHYIEHAVYGNEGAGNGNFHQLRMVLEPYDAM
jgi:hypothetical protein